MQHPPSRRSTERGATRRGRRLAALPALAAFAVVALAACGDDDDEGSDTTAAAATVAAPTTAAATTGAPATTAAAATTAAPATTGDTADTTGGTGATDATDASGSGTAGAVGVQLAESSLGEIVVDGEGITLYLFTNDEPGVSNCTGGCLDTWPPLHAEDGVPPLGEGLDAGDFAVITGADGEPQLTFHGWPLYYYAGDAAPGDVNGQSLGDVWWVIDAEGNAVTG